LLKTVSLSDKFMPGENYMMAKSEILRWLKTRSPTEVERLRNKADLIRRQKVGEEVHLRGLVELSNICARNCLYCGLRRDNRQVGRYRMELPEVLDCARMAADFGFGTLVLQGGEDYGLTADWVRDLISAIKQETGLAVTLSLGERDEQELRIWRQAGADRYLLRFETSNRDLFDRIHPPLEGRERVDRIDLLKVLRDIGYEVGSGVMVGIPGQRYEDLARDIELFAELGLDMIGVGPFIAHPMTPLARASSPLSADEQVPNTLEMGLRVVALTRLVCPRVNIPSTTALATLDGKEGREMGLRWGGNVIMPNLTPASYRRLYEIYPEKAASTETAEQSRDAALRQITVLGRIPGQGRGDSLHFLQQQSNRNQQGS
jgi:biotin synthase